jgi:hypothetical protein
MKQESSPARMAGAVALAAAKQGGELIFPLLQKAT